MEEEISFIASQTSPQLQPLLNHHSPPVLILHDPEDPPSSSSSFDAVPLPLPLPLCSSSSSSSSSSITPTDTEPSSSSSSVNSHLTNGRNKIHRCKTAPAMAVMRDLKPRNPRPDSDSNSLVRQAFLLLIIYLSLGVLIFSFNRLSFSGHRTHPVVDAIYFCIVTMCTIGYGDIAPLSPATKLFACFFVLIGFGFIDVLLSGVVNHVLDRQENVILNEFKQSQEQEAEAERPRGGGFRARNYIVDVEKGRMRIRLKVGLALGIVFFCIGIGTVVLYFGEDLSLIDAVYLSVMSVTTVGYGDRAFKTLHGRVFASIWLLFSTLAVARAFLYLAEARTDKRHRRIAKWVLHRDITVEDLRAANLNNNAFISRSEYIVYKLKEMGKIKEKDVMQICEQFNKLDRNNSGKITLPDLLQDQQQEVHHSS